MTADEKNHVITNANEELDRQMLRLDSVFPFIADEISEESRLGSLTHWAYSSKSAAKAAGSERERTRRETRHDNHHDNAEAAAAHRREARREAAAVSRKQRRAQQHADSDAEEHRVANSRSKGQASKARGNIGPSDHHAAPTAVATGQSAQKRRRVDRPPPVDTTAAMERSHSGAGNNLASKVNSRDTPLGDSGKRRARAPASTTSAARKRYVIWRVEKTISSRNRKS